MDIVRAVVAHTIQVHAFEYLQRLDTHGTLAPRAAGIDVDPLIGAVGRSVHSHMEIGQVFHSYQAAVSLVEIHDLLGDLALIKEVPGGLNRAFPAQVGVLLLGLDQALKAVGQVFLDQRLALFEGPAAGVEYLGG